MLTRPKTGASFTKITLGWVGLQKLFCATRHTCTHSVNYRALLGTMLRWMLCQRPTERPTEPGGRHVHARGSTSDRLIRRPLKTDRSVYRNERHGACHKRRPCDSSHHTVPFARCLYTRVYWRIMHAFLRVTLRLFRIGCVFLNIQVTRRKQISQNDAAVNGRISPFGSSLTPSLARIAYARSISIRTAQRVNNEIPI